jgi:hypothetical protein
MKHLLISDTHAPHCVENTLKYLDEIKQKHPDLEMVVINGDLLGIFSLESSIHKNYKPTNEQLKTYLKQCAPRFAAKFTGTLTPQLAAEFVAERYEWCLSILRRFSEKIFTVFNMGNHESPHQGLVLEELNFLLGMNSPIDRKIVEQVYPQFEAQLKKLENFKYLRNEPFVHNQTILMGIPGESHSAESPIQEAKTKEIIQKTKELLPYALSLVIYNHTQGEYTKETGVFQSGSPSLRNFIKELPMNIFTKVFVQSHNHWSYTQFREQDEVHYILNNAGLHNGICNILNITPEVKCFDVYPQDKQITELTLTDKENVIKEEELIKRNYPNPEMVLTRKKLMRSNSMQNLS